MTDRVRNILLIGGTHEAVLINEKLASRPDMNLVTSLAGRTKYPDNLSGEVLKNGFADHDGMAAFLKKRAIDLVIDASHPYAVQISRKASDLCRGQGIRYLRYERPAWQEEPGDRWIRVSSVEEAVRGAASFSRLFLSIGRQEISAFERLSPDLVLLRSVEPVSFTSQKGEVRHILKKGPFDLENEIRLLKEHDIQALVSKNSGGKAVYPKIEAARSLGLPVILLDRPVSPQGEVITSLDTLLDILAG